MYAGGPLLNLRLLGLFIFENRNSLEVTLSTTVFYRFIKSVTVEEYV